MLFISLAVSHSRRTWLSLPVAVNEARVTAASARLKSSRVIVAIRTKMAQFLFIIIISYL